MYSLIHYTQHQFTQKTPTLYLSDSFQRGITYFHFSKTDRSNIHYQNCMSDAGNQWQTLGVSNSE